MRQGKSRMRGRRQIVVGLCLLHVAFLFPSHCRPKFWKGVDIAVLCYHLRLVQHIYMKYLVDAIWSIFVCHSGKNK